MVEYALKSDLRYLSDQLNINERVNLRKQASASALRKNIFLSHSSKDKDYVVGATVLLERHGGRVYLDKLDESLPSITSKETASKLKDRIRAIPKFLVLATKESKESKWVPWELGFADSEKGLSQVAVFPVANSELDVSWAEQEYFGLYNRLVYGGLKGYSDKVWMIYNSDTHTATELREWLSG